MSVLVIDRSVVVEQKGIVASAAFTRPVAPPVVPFAGNSEMEGACEEPCPPGLICVVIVPPEKAM